VVDVAFNRYHQRNKMRRQSPLALVVIIALLYVTMLAEAEGPRKCTRAHHHG
jgi:hypothetical protein